MADVFLCRSEGWPHADKRRQLIAKWRCPECRQRWEYREDGGYRLWWFREGLPSRRWRKREAQRLTLAAAVPGEARTP